MATIAIDYDKTYTVDPKMWDIFHAVATARGHTVICVSCRAFPPNSNCQGEPVPPFKMYLTANELKRDYMEKQGVKVDIWIDDMPETIGEVYLIGK